MKIVSLFLSIIFIVLLVGCGSDVPTIDISYDDESSYVSVSSEVSSEESLSSRPAITEENAWMLTLVNPTHPLEEGYEPELSQIKTKYASEGVRFDSRAIDDLNNMCDAAYSDGVWLWIASAWRSNQRQAANFNKETNKVLEGNPHLSREEAEIIAATVVARPGTSEHELGLAVDFNSVNEDFKNTKHSAWLEEHAHEYGFILRYTEEKQHLTDIIDEPWHYRYVGVEAAKEIKEMGICLEEYLPLP